MQSQKNTSGRKNSKVALGAVLLGIALMVPAVMVGTWAYVLVAGATAGACAFLPWGASKTADGDREKGAESGAESA